MTPSRRVAARGTQGDNLPEPHEDQPPSLERRLAKLDPAERFGVETCVRALRYPSASEQDQRQIIESVLALTPGARLDLRREFAGREPDPADVFAALYRALRRQVP